MKRNAQRAFIAGVGETRSAVSKILAQLTDVASSEPLRPALPPILRLFLWGIVLLSVLCEAAKLICAHLSGWNRFPYNRMISPPEADFMDFAMFNSRFHHFHSREFFSPTLGSPYLYPAPDAMFYEFVHLVMDPFGHTGLSFLPLIAAILLFLAILLGWGLRHSGLSAAASATFAGVSLLTSYPGYFDFNRSNIEIFVWLSAGLGVWAFLRDKPWLAAALIGVAGSCKFYPYILLGLLFLRKQFWQMLFGIVVGGISLLVSSWALTTDIAFTNRNVSVGLRMFTALYIVRKNSLGLDHSIFGLYKRLLSAPRAPMQLGHDLQVYLITAAVIATLLFFLRVRNLPVSNQITFLTVATVLLPPLSYDYTLLQLYTPWAVLVFLAVRLWRTGTPPSRGLRYALICFIPLLSPQNEFIYNAETVEGQIKCVALLALAAISLLYPFEGTLATAPDTTRVTSESARHAPGSLNTVLPAL